MKLLTAIRTTWNRWRTPRTLGKRGEAAAARFLRRLGYKIVARGHRDRIGEIDLVAVDDRTVVFVEVKTRRGDRVGHPADAVDAEKQRRLSRAALGFLRRHDLLEHAARFDVIAVIWPEKNGRPRIEHFRNAFPAVGNWQMFR